MNDHTTHTHPTERRGWFGRRRHDVPDTVQIDSEDHHAWWAGRDQVAPTASARRAQERQAAAPTPSQLAAAAAFAPPTVDPEPAPELPAETWDTEALFTWAGSTTTDDPETPDGAPTPWNVLGLAPDAAWDEVVRRHRSLAKLLHPDRHANVELDVRREIEERMAQVNAAFSDLEPLYRVQKGA